VKVRAGIAIMVVSFALGLMCLQAVFGASNEEQAALESAGAWLALVDAGEYGKSWDEAASLFKSVLPKNQWEKSLQTVRKPLGKVISRATGSATYTKSLPGAPDGQYVVIQYNTSFENKKSSVETVTPMLDKDGKWRVSGYFIK
jgi:hypothetical protein